MYHDPSARQGNIRIPFHSFERTETHDAETHGRCIAGWQHSYEHLGRQPFRGCVTQLWLWPIQVIQERLEQPLVYRGTAWKNAQIFASFHASSAHVSLDGRGTIEGTLAVFPWDFLNYSFSDGPTESFTIAVQQDYLAEYTRNKKGQNHVLTFGPQGFPISKPEIIEGFQRRVEEIVGDVAACPDRLDHDSLFRSAMRNRLLDTLMQVLDASTIAAGRFAPPTTRSYIVEKAIQYMDMHLADPLSMSDVAKAIRVCPRTLRYSFEEVVGLPPTQYLLNLRLNRVRRELVQSKGTGRIHCIAQRYGFSHMGRFAQFYRDTFGERPSDTVTQIHHYA